MALLAHIRAIHAETRGAYGWPRIWRELQGRGVRAGKERIRKMMKENAIRARDSGWRLAWRDDTPTRPGASGPRRGGEQGQVADK